MAFTPKLGRTRSHRRGRGLSYFGKYSLMDFLSDMPARILVGTVKIK